jgi:hypothetical protein
MSMMTLGVVIIEKSQDPVCFDIYQSQPVPNPVGISVIEGDLPNYTISKQPAPKDLFLTKQ